MLPYSVGHSSPAKNVVAHLQPLSKPSRAAGITPPAVLVVGEVVKMRDKLNWFEKEALFGKRVLVTLPAEDNNRLSQRLEQNGAECVSLPLIINCCPFGL